MSTKHPVISTAPNPSEVMKGITQLREAPGRNLVSMLGDGVAPFQMGGLNQYLLDLSQNGASVNIARCFGLKYRRAGSAAYGLVKVTFNGGSFDMNPGDEVRGFFEQVVITAQTGSINLGFANFLTYPSPDFQFNEPSNGVGYYSADTLFDVTLTNQAGQYNTPIFAVDRYSLVKVEFKLIAASGGATNTVAVALVDSPFGDASAFYGAGGPSSYLNLISTASPFATIMAGAGVTPNSTAPGNGGNGLGIQTRLSYAMATIFMTNNTTLYSARLRILGFHE